MNLEDFYRPFFRYFRARRLRGLLAAHPDLAAMTVLDVGGTPFIWDLLEELEGIRPRRVVLLNRDRPSLAGDAFSRVQADARALPFGDGAFDLVFSNSVIEHVGDLGDMRRFAAECRRVGRGLHVQTPNRWFPVEPHLITVFVHYLPRPLARALAWVSLRFLLSGLDWTHVAEVFDGTRLLDAREVAEIFPGATVSRERVLGLTKSFTVQA